VYVYGGGEVRKNDIGLRMDINYLYAHTSIDVSRLAACGRR
jgi:hypothetical protein